MINTLLNDLFTVQLETIILFFLALVAIAHMLSSRKKPRSIIAWMLVIFVLPYIGIPLYIIFSGRKIEKFVLQKGMLSLKSHYTVPHFHSPIATFLESQAIPAVTGNNNVALCHDGIEAYRSLKLLLQNAQKSIYISTYIFGDDIVTQEIVTILVQKAREGVDVKLLIDALGSARLELFPSALKVLTNAGGEYHFFNSFMHRPMDFKINLRNHRKSIIIDCCKVMSGGMNIAQEYMSPTDHGNLWMDISFILEGEAVQYYLEIFSFDWHYTTQQTLDVKADISSDTVGKSLVQVIPSGPDVKSDALYESLLYALFLAQKRFWIVTPYFAPDQSMMDALIVAKHRGVDVRIIVPDMSDHLILDIARNGFLRQLQEEGIKIMFYKDRMLHAKVVVVDALFAVMGSSNFDERSFFYNYESVSYFYSKKDIQNVTVWIEKLFLDCFEGLHKSSKIRIVFENIFMMLSPAI